MPSRIADGECVLDPTIVSRVARAATPARNSGFGARRLGTSARMRPGPERESQERFRRANQRLHERIRAIADEDQPVPFLCECADESCMEPVPVTPREYRQVRGDESRFLVLNGHRLAMGEQVVEERGSYAVVAKTTA
jgi:hypothetical protein